MIQKLSKVEIDAIYDMHEREQVISIAKTTTPAQRVQWLEQTIDLIRKIHAERASRGLKNIDPFDPTRMI